MTFGLPTELNRISFNAQLREFENYRSYTGLEINYNKTEIMRIGSLTKTDAKIYSDFPLQWSDGPVKILGITFFPTSSETCKFNYEQALSKASNIAKMWKNRNLSLLGKILVINMLLIPQFLYKMQCLATPPQEIFNKFDQIVKEFIWKGKTHIAKDRLIQNLNNGGLKMMDLKMKDQSLKFAAFIKHANSDNTLCKHMLDKQTDFPLKAWMDGNLHPKEIKRDKKNSTTFLNDIIVNWSSLTFVEPKTGHEILEQPLWYNSNITAAKKTLIANRQTMNNMPKIRHLYIAKEKRWHTHVELTEKGNKLNYLEQLSLKAAIPKEWLRSLNMVKI